MIRCADVRDIAPAERVKLREAEALKLGVMILPTTLVLEMTHPTEITTTQIQSAFDKEFGSAAKHMEIFQFLIDPDLYIHSYHTANGDRSSPITIVHIWYYIR